MVPGAEAGPSGGAGPELSAWVVVAHPPWEKDASGAAAKDACAVAGRAMQALGVPCEVLLRRPHGPSRRDRPHHRRPHRPETNAPGTSSWEYCDCDA